MVFKNIFSLENLRYKDHCIFKQGIENNCTFFMLKHTWHINEKMIHWKK